ncbi:MAG TPA: spore coat protein U domain-containing protein [Rhodopila sp.]
MFLRGTYTDTVTASLFGFNNPVTTFVVMTTILPSCTLSATPLAFGAYTGLQRAASSTVTVTCTNTTAWSVGLDAGQASGASVTTRRMTGPAGATLAYGLYLDNAHTRQWGITINVDTAAGIGSGLPQLLAVYGLIPAGTYGRPGLYADTITATVSY